MSQIQSDEPENTSLPSPQADALASTLRNIYRELTYPCELDEIMQRLIKHLLALFKTDGVAIGLLDDNRLLWVSVRSQPSNAPYVFQAEMPPYLKGQGVGGYALQQSRVVATSDYWQDKRFERSEALDNMLREGGTVAMMAASVCLQGEPAALIWLSRREAYQWSRLEMTWLEQITPLFAIAISNARQQALFAALDKQTELQHQELVAVKKVLDSFRTATRELSKPVLLLDMELVLLAQLKTTPEPEVFERMKKALARIVDLMQMYRNLPPPQN